MNVMPSTPTVRSTVIHDKDIYQEMVKELVIAIEDDRRRPIMAPPQKRSTSHLAVSLEDYEDSDFGIDEHDEVYGSHYRKEHKSCDDVTERTTTQTDSSLNSSSWHSSTSQKSVSSSRSQSRYSFYWDATTVATLPPVHVFESPIVATNYDNHKNICNIQSTGLLGEGFFGQVFLVHDSERTATDNDGYYALKRLSKYHLLCEDQIHTAIREKQILQKCRHHPGIVTLYHTYQGDSYLYLLQSYIPGGELFTLLHNSKFNLSEESAQFYTACITDALWYLHCGTDHAPIVYRDLKPENIMINAKGYPILIDFGYAKLLSPDDDHPMSTQNTYTLCGTSKYLSPEMINGKGHNCSTDWWSLGVVVYELLSNGEHPFEFILKWMIFPYFAASLSRNTYRSLPKLPRSVSILLINYCIKSQIFDWEPPNHVSRIQFCLIHGCGLGMYRRCGNNHVRRFGSLPSRRIPAISNI